MFLGTLLFEMWFVLLVLPIQNEQLFAVQITSLSLDSFNLQYNVRTLN